MRTETAQQRSFALRTIESPIAFKRGVIDIAKCLYKPYFLFRASRSYSSRRAYSYYIRNH